VAGASAQGVSRADDAAAQRVVAIVDGCTATLERRAADARVIHLRSRCPQPAGAKAALLARMAEALLPAAAARATVETLFLGRLMETFPDLAARLARAAAAAADWDGAAARRRPAQANQLVRRLTADAALYADLEAALRPLGWRVRPGAVEKVLIAAAGDTPLRAALIAQGVPATTVVPFDAQVWLRLEPAAP
jgi:hypothetical protein